MSKTASSASKSQARLDQLGPRRAQILEKAAHLFCIKGYDSTSMSDIADAVLYLADASWVTGVILPVDGGVVAGGDGKAGIAA